MGVLDVLLNLMHRQPVRWKRWHPLSSRERAEVRRVQRLARTAPLRRRFLPLSLRSRSGRAVGGSIIRGVALRTLSLDEVLTLRQLAIDRGYDGRAWGRDPTYNLNESAFFWLRGGLRLAGGEIVCDLLVGQVDFKNYEENGTSSPCDINLKRHVLHVHRDDWRRLRRASRKDKIFAFLTLEQSVPLDLDELSNDLG
jgi:hypothetical protein